MATREAELFKDKIEVSLDGRQVFCLFCGGAVIACLVFVLGVTIGRRVEARVHPDEVGASAIASDPLAALDQLAVTDLTGSRDLGFDQALRGDGVPVLAPVDEEIAAAAPAEPDPEPEAGKPTAAPAAKPEPVPVPAAEEAPAVADPAAKPAAAKSVEAKPEAAEARFTLQLSSFQDKSEADAFMGILGDAGHRPYMIEAEVADKGTWYRVRVGRYPSYDAALKAKTDFEASQHIIAYVTRL